MHTTASAAGFAATGLSAAILSVLNRNGFTTPTPIQAKAIPVALNGGDIIGIAQTGTGKTMAFMLPILEKLLANPHDQAVVIVPTRELALQVEESTLKVSRKLLVPIRSVCLIGGMPMFRQVNDLRRNPRIIVATPGRLQDHLNQRTVTLKNVTTLVLDEADRMLDMGFAPQIQKIITSVPENRQTMLFSATLAPEIANIAQTYMKNPTRVEVARQGTSSAQIKQELCYVAQPAKTDLLLKLLNEHEGTILVFTRTKHGASKLSKHVDSMGHRAAEIHSNRSLSQRRAALQGFKTGKYRVLVATDVAARGIDVNNIAVVINYDLPDAAEDYIHRIGRTGRAGKEGQAISFATHDQIREVKSIERLMDKQLPLSEHSEEPRRSVAPAFSSSRSGSRGGNRGFKPRNSFSRPKARSGSPWR